MHLLLFSRVMDHILREFLGKNVPVYMDDIIIFNTSLQDHVTTLGKVLNKFQEVGLKIQLNKSEFLRKEVTYLGHLVTCNGVKPDPKKIEAIKNWPLPLNVKDIRSFIGTLSFYRKFIKDFSLIAKPLTNMLRQEDEKKHSSTKVIHTNESRKAFEKLKAILTSSSVLQYPDWTKPFILNCDASNVALRAVLSQNFDGKTKPISFASRTLNQHEEHLSAIEKELLAIVWACKYFRPYLFGNKFILYTDHKPLQHVFNIKDANSKLIRWRLQLEEYNYDIKYCPEKKNVADGLSRIPKKIDQENYSMTNNANDTDIETVHSANTDDTYFIPITEQPVNVFTNQIIIAISDISSEKSEEVFPKLIRHTISKNKFSIEDINQIFQEYLHYRHTNCVFAPVKILQTIQKTYKKYFSRNKNLKVKISQIFLTDIKTLEEQEKIIEQTHEYVHRGINENVAEISRKYYFPNLKKKTQKYISLCKLCNTQKYDRSPYKLKIPETPIPIRPFQIVHIDIFIATPNMYLTAVDKFSKFGIMIPIKSRNIIDLRNALTKLISRYKKPENIISDNEPALKSSEIRALLESLKIKTYYTPVNRSETNAIVERFHSTIAEIYRLKKPEHANLSQKEVFQIAVSLYNDTIHSTTKLKPSEVFFAIKEQEREIDIEKIMSARDEVYDSVILKLNQKNNSKEKINKKREDPPKLETNQKNICENSRN